MEEKTLREVTVKIGLERVDMQEGITVEALLDSGATGLVMSSEFARKQGSSPPPLLYCPTMPPP